MWGVPVDHDRFSEVSTSQWLWYYHNFNEDQEEAYTRQRDFVEYHASFIEPEAVRKIREARAESVEVPHEEFVAGIEYFFGRGINLPEKRRKGSESISIDPKSAVMRSDNHKKHQIAQQQEKTVRIIDYRYWLNLDLE